MKLSEMFVNADGPIFDRVVRFFTWCGITKMPMINRDGKNWPIYLYTTWENVRLPKGYRDKLTELGLDMEVKDDKDKFVRLFFKEIGK